MSENKDFFKKQTDSSRVKATIISEYFPSYCKIIGKRHTPRKFGYYDMFAGPGMYEDGSLSTPLLIAAKCAKDDILRDKVWMVFNDMVYGDTLKENFEASYPDGTFKYKPYFANRVFGEWTKINDFLTKNTMEGFYNECPALLFIDPFGYKHINTSILAKFLTYWGNEVFIFVNTKRLNAAFENEKFQDDLKIIFPETYQTIKDEKKLISGTVEERHAFIIENLGKEFQKVLNGRVYYTAFQFREEDQRTPSHYLLHITKGAKGYELVKQIYSQYANIDRVLNDYMTYTFDPKKVAISEMDMFGDDFKQANLDVLKEQLLKKFAKRTISSEELFNIHQKECLYARTHFTSALRQLYQEGKIAAEIKDGKNHRESVLIIKECYITFK